MMLCKVNKLRINRDYGSPAPNRRSADCTSPTPVRAIHEWASVTNFESPKVGAVKAREPRMCGFASRRLCMSVGRTNSRIDDSLAQTPFWTTSNATS
jgi:hypothetical protein